MIIFVIIISFIVVYFIHWCIKKQIEYIKERRKKLYEIKKQEEKEKLYKVLHPHQIFFKIPFAPLIPANHINAQFMPAPVGFPTHMEFVYDGKILKEIK